MAVIGAALDLGAGRRGVDMGPSAIRYAGLEPRIEDLGRGYVDYGNVATPEVEAIDVGDERMRYLDEILRACEQVADRVAAAKERGELPLVLGGDHSVALGTLGGLARAAGQPGGVIWIDAHGDLNRPDTSPSGNVHGMPLAAAMGLAGPAFESDHWPLPSVDPSRVALIGTRSLDDGERALLKELKAAVFTMSDLDRDGIEQAVNESLAKVAGPGFVHVSLDMDVVDPEAAPGVGTPVRGGPLLPRGAPGDGARRRVRPRRLAGGRRGESDPRPRERDREAGGRAGRERARRANPLVEKVAERLGGLVERVPVDRVAARDGDGLEQVAELRRGTCRGARRESATSRRRAPSASEPGRAVAAGVAMMLHAAITALLQ